MKFFKLCITALLLYSFFALFGTSLTSCKKQTVHDTTTITIHDTTIIKDTTVIKDTVTITDTIKCNLTTGMIAYYNFNGGNLNDSSGNNNNIIFSNAKMTTDRLGNPNSAYLFDGGSS